MLKDDTEQHSLSYRYLWTGIFCMPRYPISIRVWGIVSFILAWVLPQPSNRYTEVSSTLSLFCISTFFRSWETRSATVDMSIMEPSYIYFNSRDELLRVETSSIVYFEADGNYTEIVLANGLKDIVCMNLAKMQRVISVNMKDKAARFVRIGKRFIINMNYVHHIHILQQSIVLSDQKTFSYNLKISKEALKSLKEIMTQTSNK